MNRSRGFYRILINHLTIAIVLFYHSDIPAQPVFTDVSESAGIDHIFEVFQGIFGGGAAVIDFNQDGWEDIFIASGAGEDQLLENNRDGTFKNVTIQSGLGVLNTFISQGAVVADVNKDRWPDLLVTTIATFEDEIFIEARNVLLINNQDGTFSDQTLQFGLVEATFSTGAAFGDVNKDGFPDLYVSNYFDSYEGNLDRFEGPVLNGSSRPGRDLFYINQGGRRFVEVSEEYGIVRQGLTFQALWSDIDNDNDLDILVANDFGNRGTPNLMYRNEYPEQKFTEIGAEKNFNYGINGMGIGVTDINMDGWLDYLVTNIQVSPFFVNQGSGLPFIEQSVQWRIGYSAVGTDEGNRVFPVSWGVNFFDVDHDMDQDLYITNGCLNPSLVPNPNLMLENDGDLFIDFGFFSGINDHSIGRGSVVFDYDRDGDMDLLVVNQTPHREDDIAMDFKGTRLYRNDNTKKENNWLKVKLEGIRSESSGIGSRVEVFVGDKLLVREIYGGSSHESQNSTIAHFGLGKEDRVDSLVIKWTASGKQVIQNVDANQLISIEEDTGLPLYKLNVYPNPFNQSDLYFDLPPNYDGLPADVRLYDISGQAIFSEKFSRLHTFGNVLTVDHSLSPGVYMCLITGESFTLWEKIIKVE